jgi:hypothetical protein
MGKGKIISNEYEINCEIYFWLFQVKSELNVAMQPSELIRRRWIPIKQFCSVGRIQDVPKYASK